MSHQKIFQEVPNDIDETWEHMALLGGMAEDAYNIVQLANAYKLAGDILIEQALTQFEPYMLIYPIIFNYRHSIELFLKSIIKSAPLSHKLQPLVQELDKYTMENYKIRVPKWFKDYIKEFEKYDERGTSFRYSDVGVSKHEEIIVDLPHLRKVMDNLQANFGRLIELAAKS